MPRLFHIHTTHGDFELYAVTMDQAVAAALELAGPGAQLIRAYGMGEW